MAAPSSNNYVSAKRLSEVVYGKEGTGGQHVDGLWDKTKALVSDKADKVSGATSGNFASLDSNGNLTDSGKKAADFKTVQTAKSSPTASGNALAFIDTVSQNANGVITATKKSVTVDSTYSASGTNPVNGKAVDAALKTLDSNATSTDGTNVQVKVTEADGKITAVNITTDNTENKNNKKQSIDDSSTTDFPSSKAVADFVNSSVATNTANYISNSGEPFTSVAQLEAYSGTVTNNDYAFVTGTDTAGNTYYDRYKATVSGSTVTWAKEFRLNNSSFTATQWAAINSNITSALVTSYNSHLANTSNPHSVTKSQVGLGNVVNTGDSATPVSGGTTKFTTGGAYTELNKKADKSSTVTNVAYDTTNKKITKTINGTTTDVVSASTLKTDMSLNNVGNFKAVSTVASQGLSSTEQSNARANIGAGTGTYSKPSGGIPSSDMSSAVQSSLTKADNAIPSSQKGAASGVGTLDANGVQPYSETYKGYVVSGDAIFKLCRIPKNATYSGGVSFAFVSRAYNKASGQVLLWISPCEHEDSSVTYKVVNMFSRANDVTMQFFYKDVTVDSNSYVDVYFRVYGSSHTHVMPLWMRNGVLDMLSTSSVSLPANAVEMTSRFFNVCAAKGGVGSASTPIYVNNAGNAAACNVGIANGLASLDSSGYLPYAQTYRGYYNSTDSSTKTIKIGRFKTGSDTRDAGGVSFSIVYRGATNKSGQMLVWLSTHDVNTATKAYKTVLFNRGAGIDDSSIKIYTDSITESSVNYVDLYVSIGSWRSVRIVPLWGNPDSWTPVFTTASLPSGAVEVSDTIFVKSAGAAGSESLPVHIDATGMAQACTSLTPIPTSYSAASATKGYKIATVENSGGGDPMYAGCMIAVCLRDNGGADCQIILSVSFSEYGTSADTEPISGKAFTLHNRLTTVGAIRFFVNRVSASKYDIYAYTNGNNNYLSCQCISGKGVTINSSPSSESITIANMTELTRSRAIVAQESGQIGSSTRPVYVNASGVVQPCDEAGYIRLADGPQQSYTPGVCYLI